MTISVNLEKSRYFHTCKIPGLRKISRPGPGPEFCHFKPNFKLSIQFSIFFCAFWIVCLFDQKIFLKRR
ncbi:Protein CBG27020 [Caenorhabditis briggsae]|uniref:Protein CBG27020 n=1 Tax=Caenorhabditis briggsae TaxID=6238 RepID=B6IH74_CAEBR|nr:Protein CBG27020 [Caenorhabditis briggsae]CAR99254.1 Protein CBG27020 [Caenorhabditis briggsae]